MSCAAHRRGSRDLVHDDSNLHLLLLGHRRAFADLLEQLPRLLACCCQLNVLQRQLTLPCRVALSK